MVRTLHRKCYARMGIVINYDFPEPLHPDDKDDVKSVEVDALQRVGHLLQAGRTENATLNPKTRSPNPDT